tara:strand:- start:1594 stop:2745 length:1152 start_codon:yes stop_codon:yes gene_type:complete
MKKKIFYWSPCLNPVGTVKSTINSAAAFAKYNRNYDVYIIDVCGEWINYKDFFIQNSIKIIKLNFNYFKYLPKTGFLGSRLSYVLIYLLSFFPLLLLLKKEKPDLIILHLITSLPLTLLSFFKFKTKFILRISGYPKLNFLRKLFWIKISRKLNCITCPTEALRSELISNKIFPLEKIFYLQDAIIDIKDYLKNTNKKINEDFLPKNKKIVLAAGRLTRQKNFQYLIEEFKKFSESNNDYILVILGEGELEQYLQKKILDEKLADKIYLLGRKENVYSYMKISEIFVLSSLWEEVGFVIVEAALNNLFIISSDCPNGPSEFLNFGKNGILFKSNVDNQLNISLQKYTKLKSEKIFYDKFMLKKKSKNYTKFQHYKKLQKILSS